MEVDASKLDIDFDDTAPIEKPAAQMTLAEQLQAQKKKMEAAASAPPAPPGEKPPPPTGDDGKPDLSKMSLAE